MTVSYNFVDQDYIIETLIQEFQCSVLWCEGRACLEYNDQKDLDRWADYVRSRFGKELLDVFFTAVERVPVDS